MDSIIKATVGGKTENLLLWFERVGKPHKIRPSDGVAIAAINGHSEAIKLLLEAGLRVDVPGAFGLPLRAASLIGHEPSVRVLLDHGTDVNANPPPGTALHAAAVRGNTQVARLLIRNDATVDLGGGGYGTALHAAAFHGHKNMVQLLIGAGADM